MFTATDRANLINQARDAVKPLTVEALKKDPGLAFQPGSINAFVALRSLLAELARWQRDSQVGRGFHACLNRQMKPATANIIIPMTALNNGRVEFSSKEAREKFRACALKALDAYLEGAVE